ncbi:MAG: carboxylating nicotinate-nucleotide diphosphorylase [Polyangiaceae bacterium]|nr:carboxylating nicotinate-nucleotide diphosphorylase [Polyangiaceae bacterium]
MLLTVAYESLIDAALVEDVGAGDLTTQATVPQGVLARAVATARAPLVVCGGDVFAAVFGRVDSDVQVTVLARDGTTVQAGAPIWQVRGEARSLLLAERVALNFAQRMSGIATATRAYVDKLPAGCRTRITDTRKTTPLLRALERYAVRVGGGHNHRDNLGSSVLIKDNHIVASGGIGEAIIAARRFAPHTTLAARRFAPHTTRIEVEVDSLAQFDEAMSAGADIIMLDNFEIDDIHEAVRRSQGRVVLEVSGGVRLERIEVLARCGVDVISVGALTHSAPAADIGLDLELLT